VALPDDEQPIQALGTNCPDPALCVGVRVRRLDRRQHDVGALRAEHVVEAVVELRVTVAQQEAPPASLLSNTSSRLRACWVTHAALGWRSSRPGGPGGFQLGLGGLPLEDARQASVSAPTGPIVIAKAVQFGLVVAVAARLRRGLPDAMTTSGAE
jgi:hypothetical protein